MQPNYLTDFIELFYPRTCKACGKALNKGEDWICAHCLLDMPTTDFWNRADNSVNQLFWGRTKMEFASAFLHFAKGSHYRHLIHSLKYKDDCNTGIRLGELYGYALVKGSLYPTIDAIIPVPLHPKKFKIRGYNQAECIAQGLSNVLKVPCRTDVLIRTVHTPTQTKKNKEQRWNNVSGVFDVPEQAQVQGQHLLIVDDVITTGATIEHCAMTLQQKGGARVSLACIAHA